MVYVFAAAWFIGFILLRNKSALNLPANLQVIFKGLKIIAYIIPFFIGYMWYYFQVQEPREKIDEMFENGAESLSNYYKMIKKGDVTGEFIILSSDGNLFADSGNGTWNTDPDNHLIKLHYTNKEVIIKVTKNGYGDFKGELENGEPVEFVRAGYEQLEEFQKLKQVEFSIKGNKFSL